MNRKQRLSHEYANQNYPEVSASEYLSSLAAALVLSLSTFSRAVAASLIHNCNISYNGSFFGAALTNLCQKIMAFPNATLKSNFTEKIGSAVPIGVNHAYL